MLPQIETAGRIQHPLSGKGTSLYGAGRFTQNLFLLLTDRRNLELHFKPVKTNCNLLLKARMDDTQQTRKQLKETIIR